MSSPEPSPRKRVKPPSGLAAPPPSRLRRRMFAKVPRNLLGGGEAIPEGGFTRFLGDGSGELMPIYDAAMRYTREGIELVVLAGKEYGSGSSRDWAAKGTKLLGVRAVIAQSFERIHRS